MAERLPTEGGAMCCLKMEVGRALQQASLLWPTTQARVRVRQREQRPAVSEGNASATGALRLLQELLGRRLALPVWLPA
jgi:hypothetical protein